MYAIVNGKSIPVNWMWKIKQTGTLMFETVDLRPLSQVAKDWEEAKDIVRESEEEGDLTYEGDWVINRITREKINGEYVYQFVLIQEGK